MVRFGDFGVWYTVVRFGDFGVWYTVDPNKMWSGLVILVYVWSGLVTLVYGIQ